MITIQELRDDMLSMTDDELAEYTEILKLLNTLTHDSGLEVDGISVKEGLQALEDEARRRSNSFSLEYFAQSSKGLTNNELVDLVGAYQIAIRLSETTGASNITQSGQTLEDLLTILKNELSFRKVKLDARVPKETEAEAIIREVKDLPDDALDMIIKSYTRLDRAAGPDYVSPDGGLPIRDVLDILVIEHTNRHVPVLRYKVGDIVTIKNDAGIRSPFKEGFYKSRNKGIVTEFKPNSQYVYRVIPMIEGEIFEEDEIE